MKPFLIFLLLITSFDIYSQDELVNDNTVSEAELHVAINPTDTNNIVIAVQNLSVEPNITIYYTKNFGTTWNISNYTATPNSLTMSGDPVLSFDDLGNIYLISLAIEGFNLRLLLSKSSDGGETWTHVSTLENNMADKPWFTIDNSNDSPNKGNMYIPFVGLDNVKLYTLDENYQKIDSILVPDSEHLPSVVVDREGIVFTSSVHLTEPNRVYVHEYLNGASSVVHSTEVVNFKDFTFNSPDVSLRFQPTVYLAVDNSGGDHDGRLYLSYTASEEIDSSYFDIFLKYSDDNGVTWSSPKVVHSNQESKVQQFYSSIYVNDSGVLIIDWYDRKNYSNTTKMTDFYMGISYDGGDTFTETLLSSQSSDFNTVIPSYNDFGIGEYHQVVATENTAISFWADGRTNDGNMNIYMAKVALQNNSTTSVIEQSMVSNKISISNLYPIPAKKIAYVDINIAKQTNLKYELFDIEGKKVFESEWENFKKGTFKLDIKLDIENGNYLVKIISDRGYFKILKLQKQ